jgi:hypothetical protein
MTGIRMEDDGISVEVYRFIYLLFLASFSSSYPGLPNYNTGQDLISDDFLHPEIKERNVLKWLNDTSATIVGLNDFVPNGWQHLMDKEYLNFFRHAISNNIEDPCTANYQVGFNDKLCDALRENDLTELLETATFDIHLCHSIEDDLVSYNNLPDISRNPNYLSLSSISGNHVLAIRRCLDEVIDFLVDPCPFEEELLGRTFFVPKLGACWKIELFAGGNLYGDYSNPACLNEVYIPTLAVSTFNFGVGNKVYFKNNNGGWNGHFNIVESTTSKNAEVNIITNDLVNQEFMMDIVFPKNHISDRFYYGKTIYVRAWDACWKIELFENGVMDGDHRPTKARCSKETHRTHVIVSNFDYGSGKNAHFKKSRDAISTVPYDERWTGNFRFRASSDVTQIEVITLSRIWEEKTFDVEIIMPLLHCSKERKII